MLVSSVTLQTAHALFDNQFSDAHLPTWASDQSNMLKYLGRVVAQLAEQWPPTAENPGSNTVIGSFY